MGHMKKRRDEVAARFYTEKYRIYGHLFLVPGRSTADLLNMDQSKFISVTKAKLFTAGAEHPPLQSEFLGQVPFLGINREEILWVLGGRPPDPAATTMREQKVSFLFDGFLVAGVVRMRDSQRLTDLLYTSSAFLPIFKVQVFPCDAQTPFSQLSMTANYEFATLNIQRTISVVEI